MIVVSITGLGNVGKQVCSLLLGVEQPITINIIENDDMKYGYFLDLSHAAELYDHCSLTWNDHTLFSQSNYIFHTAGGNIKLEDDRNSVLSESINICTEIYRQISFEVPPRVIVLSNPIEEVCLWMRSITEDHLIIGTGTLLDTSRLRYYSSTLINQTEGLMVIGEHNKNMTPVIGKNDLILLEQSIQDTLNAAHSIKEKVGNTSFGVAHCALKIFKALIGKEILNDPVCIMPSIEMRTQFGLEEKFMSYPCQIEQGKLSLLVTE